MSLEDDFWFAFRDISEELNRPINDLAAEIDEMRGEDCGLASAIRLFVLNDLQDRLTSDDPVA